MIRFCAPVFSFRAIDILPAVFVVLAMLLGGASAANAGALANGLLQLVSIGVLGWVYLESRRKPIELTRGEGVLLLIWLATALWLAITLIPLPPGLWTLLPGRDFVVGAYKMAGMELPWLPISLSPSRTIWSGLSLLPVLAVLFLTFRTSHKGLKRMVGAMVVVTAIAALIGISQVITGQESPLYIYEFTNRGMATGLFSNANHFASSIIVCLPFLALIPTKTSSRRRSTDQKVAQYAGVGSFAIVLFGALLLTQSVAAWLLAAPAVVAAWLLWRGRALTPRGLGVLALLALLAIALLVAGLLFVPDMFEAVGRYTSAGGDVGAGGKMARSDIYPASVNAIPQFMPLGAGLGSFAQIYPLFENAQDVGRSFANHAHSDYLELTLELGIPAVLLIAAGLWWWARKTLVIWMDAVPSSTLARAASISAGILIAHSLVDYPLRTAALAVIFAALMAVLARPDRT
jgi:O-antigen ligase